MNFKTRQTRIILFSLIAMIFSILNIQEINAMKLYGTYKPTKGGAIRLEINEVNNDKETKTIELLDSYGGISLYLFEWLNKETGRKGRYIIYAPDDNTNIIHIKPIGSNKRDNWIKVK